MTEFFQWYRDKGNGQHASDVLGATESSVGYWPIAMLPCPPEREYETWKRIYETFGVNATYVRRFECSLTPTTVLA